MTDPRVALASFVRRVMRDLTFARSYGAVVTVDHGDGTVDVEPDDPAVRGLGVERRPVWTGVAGVSGRVEPGTRCVIAFAGRDPSRPYIAAWKFAKGSAVVNIDSGVASVARFGDSVLVIGTPGIVPIVGTVQGVATPPVGAPIPLPPGPVVGTVTVPVPVRGTIQMGAPKVWG